MRISPGLLVGIVAVLLLAATATLSPIIAPQDPTAQNLEQDLRPSSASHPLGTDKLGRDILSRILYGARISLLVGITTVSISLSIGVIVGSLSGYYGGWIDRLVMRIVDVLLSFPGILLAIAFAAMLGPGLRHTVLALSLVGWTAYARLVRGEILSLREREFVQAARAIGCGSARIVRLHLLPNIFPVLLIQATFGMAAAIVGEGSLSFLGLGVAPPTPSWGAMLNEGRQFLLVAPHITAYPGIAISITVLALNLIGDGLTEKFQLR